MSVIKGIDNILSIPYSAVERVERLELPIPAKPVEVVEGIDILVEWDRLKTQHGGISNIPTVRLGDFFDKWTALLAYTRWVEAVADIEHASIREARDMIKKQIYTIKEGSRELRDALVYTDEEYIKLSNLYIEKLTFYILMKALRESYEYRVTAISREITRRGYEITDVVRRV